MRVQYIAKANENIMINYIYIMNPIPLLILRDNVSIASTM